MAVEHFGPLGDQRYKAYAAGIASTARHLLDVIEAMLRGTEERLKLSASADLDATATLAVEGLRTLAEANRIAVRLETASSARAAISPTVLRQLLLNLIANAIKHAGLEANVVVRSGLTPDGKAWIEIEDDGPGIPASVAERLSIAKHQGLDLLNRVEPSTGEGHGFGLQITMAMAKANGAELELIPVKPHGTRARMKLATAR
jgi:two-component system cell cycle sensor histidine kinase PleC